MFYSEVCNLAYEKKQTVYIYEDFNDVAMKISPNEDFVVRFRDGRSYVSKEKNNLMMSTLQGGRFITEQEFFDFKSIKRKRYS